MELNPSQPSEALFASVTWEEVLETQIKKADEWSSSYRTQVAKFLDGGKDSEKMLQHFPQELGLP